MGEHSCHQATSARELNEGLVVFAKDLAEKESSLVASNLSGNKMASTVGLHVAVPIAVAISLRTYGEVKSNEQPCYKSASTHLQEFQSECFPSSLFGCGQCERTGHDKIPKAHPAHCRAACSETWWLRRVPRVRSENPSRGEYKGQQSERLAPSWSTRGPNSHSNEPSSWGGCSSGPFGSDHCRQAERTEDSWSLAQIPRRTQGHPGLSKSPTPPDHTWTLRTGP